MEHGEQYAGLSAEQRGMVDMIFFDAAAALREVAGMPEPVMGEPATRFCAAITRYLLDCIEQQQVEQTEVDRRLANEDKGGNHG